MNTRSEVAFTTEPDLAVVGGGIAGLLAATAAARRGLSVVLLERGLIGGRAQSVRSDRGFTLNRGPHALYVDGELHTALGGLGIAVDGMAPPLKGARGLVGSRLGLLPAGPASLLQTGLVPLGAKPRLGRLLATIGRLDPAELGSTTVEEWLDDQRLHPDARALVAALVRLTTYCVDHGQASADMAVGQIQRALTTGVLYLDGGWQQIVDRLAIAAREAGVEIRERAAVSSVENGAGHGMAIHLEGDERIQPAVTVIAGLSPEAIDAMVPDCPDLRSMAGPNIEAAALDLGIAGSPEIGFVLGVDEPLYYSRHARPAALAPDGHTLYAAMRYLRAGEGHDREATVAQLRSLVRTAGVVAEDVVEERYLHRLTVANGLPLAEKGGLAGRPGVDVLGPGGPLIAGDWVGPHGVLADASAASALAAVDVAVSRVGASSVAA